MTRILEWGLRIWSVAHVAAAVLWSIGPYGAGYFSGDGPLDILGPPLLAGLSTGPIVAVYLTDSSASASLSEVATELNGYDQVQIATGAFGDINVGWSAQFSLMTGPQEIGWLMLHLVPLLVLAALWWMLATVVAQSRHRTVFTSGNARWLTRAGGVVLLGAPLLSLLTWRFDIWVTESSQLADRIRLPGYSWDRLPWTAMAAGVVLVVLGRIWARGAVMEHDLGGLV